MPRQQNEIYDDDAEMGTHGGGLTYERRNNGSHMPVGRNGHPAAFGTTTDGFYHGNTEDRLYDDGNESHHYSDSQERDYQRRDKDRKGR